MGIGLFRVDQNILNPCLLHFWKDQTMVVKVVLYI